jgi:hypothetical protein
MLWPLLLMMTMQAATPSPVTIIARDLMSQVDAARTAVAQTPSEWAALWREHSGDTKAPAVDLSTRTVVAVFLGSRPSAGYAVDIVGTTTADGAMIVKYQERRPDRGDITAQVLTSPAVIATVPKFTGTIRFEKVEP